MANTAVSDILWITAEPGERKYLQNGQKGLVDMCSVKLVSDVSLITQYCQRLPKQLFLVILRAAIAKRRILSIRQLMKYCPLEILELPVPEILKSVCTAAEKQNTELKQFINISFIMLSTFFDHIREKKTNSKLQTLDFGCVPLPGIVLNLLDDFLVQELTEMHSLTRGYTLKCAVTLESSNDLNTLYVCAGNAVSLGFNLSITGVYFHNNHFPDVQAVRIFDCLNGTDLQLIAFNFANIVPRFDLFLANLSYFREVKYLNLSYLADSLSSAVFYKTLARTLIELPSLQRLVLKGIKLTGKLTMIFCEYCKNNHSDVAVPNCCLVHNGSLHYLDVSCCGLVDNDLEFLRQMALTDSLKYLNISDSTLYNGRTFEILLCLASSLQVLNMSNSFKRHIEYDNAVFPFSAFTKLKYLNIEGLNVPQGRLHILEDELKIMQNLEVVIHSVFHRS